MNDHVPAPPSIVPPSPKTSGLAIASMYLGILGATCFLPVVGSILAITFGVLALNKIKESNGGMKGKGRAIAGFVLGGIGLILIPMVAAAILVPNINAAREHERRYLCMNNLKAIGVAVALYAEEHDGTIPRKFEDLHQYNTSDKVYVCPSARVTTGPSYEIVLGGKKLSTSEAISSIVVTEPLANHRVGCNALYGDGHVEYKGL